MNSQLASVSALRSSSPPGWARANLNAGPRWCPVHTVNTIWASRNVTNVRAGPLMPANEDDAQIAEITVATK